MSELIEKEVTVEELKKLYNSGLYTIEIDTPDDYQKIGKWFDKGVLPIIEVSTKNYKTSCAENHLVQLKNKEWVLASELVLGDVVITQNGNEEIISIVNKEPQECFDFEILSNNHRYWGDGISSHNSGKSLVVSGNIIKDAQKQGIFIVLIDSENALDEDWLQALGVDTSEDKLLKLNMAMVGDVAKTISDFVKQYREIPKEERPKVLFVVDSLGMLLVESNVAQFDEGSLSGDFGIKPKQLKAMITNCVNMFGDLDIGMVATQHCYSSQNKYDPDGIISGGSGFIFASSIIVSMEAFKLKEDADGNKIKEVAGINSKCKVVKSRYNKPFETVNIHIPYSEGMSLYSGLFDLFYEKQHLLTKEGNRYVYVDLSGKEHKHWKKDYNANKDGILDLIMKEFDPERVNTVLEVENEDTPIED